MSGKEPKNPDKDAEDQPNTDDFLSAMSDVTPLNVDQRVTVKSDSPSEVSLKQRRKAAVEQSTTVTDTLSGEFVKPVDPTAVLEFKRPGVQHGVYKNLRLGKYPIEARLDLHGMSVEQSRRAVSQFVDDCLDNDVRCALVTHGKGVDRKPQPAMLKSCIAHWLPQLEQVLAFHSAQKQHGGVGATYVLLRKSQKKKQENAEKHQKRK